MTNRNFYEYFQFIKDKEIPFALLDVNFKFIQVNEKYEVLFGFKENELVNKFFFIHFSHLNAEELNKITSEFNEFKKTEKFVYKKIEVITSKKEIKILEIKFKFFLFGEDSFSLISVKELDANFNPIQNYSSIEFNQNEILIQKMKLIKLNEIILNQKNDIQIIAHEIISPIGAVKNLVEILDSKNLEQTNKNFFEMILTSLDHILKISDNLIEISNLDSSTDFELTEIELVSFLKEILEIFIPIAFKKNISLYFDSEEDEFFYKVNKEKFYFAISNLISNAIKFSYENSKVELKFEIENFSPKIQVIDSGVGISEEQKIYLFQKFSKSKRIGTTGEKSTGLGLYIVKEIIEKHGGEIQIESVIGQGSIFTLYFPQVEKNYDK